LGKRLLGLLIPDGLVFGEAASSLVGEDGKPITGFWA